jgi:large subunit ribosomal protein L30
MSPAPKTAAAATPGQSASLRVVQERSRNGSNKAQRATLRSLGLLRIGHAVEVTDTPQSRGMLHAVRHLVRVEEEGKQ